MEGDLKELMAIELSSLQHGIIRQLLYYDLFNYPLTQEELFVDETQLHELEALVESGLIYRNDEYYSIEGNVEDLQRRIEGNLLCDKVMEKAISRAKFIYQFPFVEGVYLSGSVSKGFLTPDGDVDFFIITKPNRLWLSRTILILFKKIFLGNSRKFFCLNYFIDSNHLEIEEKNYFTATELVTLIPVCTNGAHEQFIQVNDWIKKYHPNGNFKSRLENVDSKSFWSKALESFLSLGFGAWLDRRCMDITLKVWKQKFGDFEPEDFELALKSRRYVSKHHPRNFQKKVLDRFEKNVQQFESKHKLEIDRI